MKKFSFLFALVLLFSCSEKPSGPTAGQIAAQAAKVYYDQLLKGDYGIFVDGRYQPHNLPESYRQQLIANAKMYVDQQNKEHKGIKEVKVTAATADTTKHVANAYLTLTFGDNRKEEVVVPMVENGGTWYMK